MQQFQPMEMDVDLLAAFASVVKRRRKELKLSQEKLAHWASINRTFVAKIETCRHQPSLTTIHYLAIALNTDAVHLMREVLSRYRPRTECPAQQAQGIFANTAKRLYQEDVKALRAYAALEEDEE